MQEAGGGARPTSACHVIKGAARHLTRVYPGLLGLKEDPDPHRAHVY